MKKLYLIDGHALVYRVYYAFMKRPIMNSKGLDTSVLYGFTKTLMEIIMRERPSHIGVAFDPGGKNFRHEWYPEYKANRQPTPEVIAASLPLLKDLIEAFNIPLLILPGYEADDLIGTIAKRAEKEGFSVYMLTPDKDYAQLVSSHIFMMKPRSGGEVEQLGVNEVCKLYNIQQPEQLIDVLALWGDAVDNVPGVDGVGEVRAKKLIGEWGSIENVYAHFNELPKSLQPAFEAAREQIPLSKKLITINTQAPVPWDEEALATEKPDIEKLKSLFKEYEFVSLMPHLMNYGREYGAVVKDITTTKAVNKPAAAAAHGQLDLFAAPPTTVSEASEAAAYQTIRSVAHNYHIVHTDVEVDRLAALLLAAEQYCFDTETTGAEAMNADLVGLSFAVKAHEAWYVPLPRGREAAAKLLEKFAPIFNSPIPKIGQNIKFDLLMLKQYGINVNGALYDTMLMHYLIEPEGRHNMNVLSRAYLNYMPIEIEELIGKKGVKQGSMADVPLAIIAEYAAEDADITFQLKEILEKELRDKQLFELYSTIEAPLIKVLADMEYQGVKIDAASLTEYGKQLQSELLLLDEEIKQLAGEPTLNISSPKQLGIILFEKLGLAEKAKLTKTKQYSTDEESLQNMAAAHPIIPKILTFRSLRKLLSSYIEALPALVNQRTGKIHTTFNQFVTATGRLSSNHPNLQNIPIRDDKGREIRRAFVASGDDHILLSADYSQIELRIMAHVSGDPNMVEAFCRGEDIHTATAAKIWHIGSDEVTKEQRSKAKVANFGIIYGISGFGLAQRLQIPRSEAKILIDGYFAAYPEVKAYIDQSIAKASEKGYVETIFGRVRHLRDIHSNNASVRGFAQRNAVNAPIQGTAADIIKLAMINIYKKLEENYLQTKMILQVHDELVFDVYLPELEKIKEIVQQEMEEVKTLLVPLTVEVGMGKNWLEAH
ncbi:MAG: DNA polymerase I [Bacteroidales bacterium]|nr:DNA polymerase I [Bacteroidales bacterium]MCL2133245.1 DNA polymerase I [Bacteroidales bacterium]